MSPARRPDTGNVGRQPPTRKVTGFPMGVGHDFRGAAGLERDYEQLFPDTDKMYHECDEDARVWHVYNEESDQIDREMLAQSGDALDASLIFGSLFSAVITTFVSQTSNLLPRDNAALTVDVLVELSHLIRAQMNGTNHTTIQPVDTYPRPESTNIVLVNVLWYTSLVLSLATALFAVLAKQWLRHYASPVSGSTPRERATIHQYRLRGFKAWGVPTIVGLLPTFLHMSLLIFLGGLFLYLDDLHPVLSRAIGGLSLAVAAIYLFFLAMPVLFIHCPYQGPFTELLSYSLLVLVTALYAGVVVAALTLMICLYSLVYIAKATMKLCCNQSKEADQQLTDMREADQRLTDMREWFGLIFDIIKSVPSILTLGSRWWMDRERYLAAPLEMELISSATQWLWTATPNESAKRIAWQSIAAVPGLQSEWHQFKAVWESNYLSGFPALNKVVNGQEDLFRQAERSVRSWIVACGHTERGESIVWLPPRSPLDVSHYLAGNEGYLMKLLKATESTAEPAILLALLYNVNWHPTSAYSNELLGLLYRRILDLDPIPNPGAQPFAENQCFLDFVAHSANPAPAERPPDDQNMATLEEALHYQLKEKGWFDDPRIVERVAKLQTQSVGTDVVPPLAPSSSPRSLSLVIDGVGTDAASANPGTAAALSSALIPPQDQEPSQSDPGQHEQNYPPRPAPPADGTVLGVARKDDLGTMAINDSSRPTVNRHGHLVVEFKAESS